MVHTLEATSGSAPAASACDDGTIDQAWHRHTAEDHAVWKILFERQARLLPGRVTETFLAGLHGLAFAAEGIPDFRQLSERLEKATGWQVVAVPGLVPDETFFRHLANRRFPATSWIRDRRQLDYLEEPDVFHDVFGHVPLLMDPVFADYMQAYGEAGLGASGLGVLHRLARLYWYTVEFGLVRAGGGLQIYGAGIVSSKSESVFCLDDPSPNRIGFDLERVMRTHYRIDDFQETYFVVRDFAQLLSLLEGDLCPVYGRLEGSADIEPGTVCDGDAVITRGTGAYHRKRR